jgi:hypothetical protein
MSVQVRGQLAELYRRVNGEHPMTAADDTYVDEYFTPLDKLCAEHGVDADRIRMAMLERRMPLPSYLRSDGTEMVPFSYLEVIEGAGGVDGLKSWFRQRWLTASQADSEWADFVDGHYLCLREPVPEAMARKSELIRQIEERVGSPEPEDEQWLAQLHEMVDELDALEQPFTGYDRLRFGGPVSRDTCIDDVRRQFRRPAERDRSPGA